LNFAKFTKDPQRNLADLADKHLAKLYENMGDVPKDDELMEKTLNLLRDLGVETGYALLSCLKETDHNLAIDIKNNLQKEFNCQTYSEKMLVDLVANSYIRELSYSRLMEVRNTPEYLSHEKTGMLNFYSHEVDRAHRQFISGIETLKLMKEPALRVSIRTNNAFVSDKQQFNNNVENNESK